MERSGHLAAPLFTMLLAITNVPAAAEDGSFSQAGEFLGGKETTYPDWFKDSFLEFADDVEEAAEEGRRVLIFFHQDGCPYCNALVERNLSQKHIEDKIRASFDVIALNLRGARDVVSVGGETYTEKSFARALNVQFTPTLLFLDESGKIVLRLNGYIPPRELDVALDYASGEADVEADYLDYLASRLPPADSGELIREPFFASAPHDLQAALGEGRPLAVFFEQRQCPNCAALHRDILADPETSTTLQDFHAVQLDMWSEQTLVTPTGSQTTAREWAGELGVRYAPTIVLFSREGDEVIRSEAYFKRFHTQSIFDYVASGAHAEEADFQRYLTIRSDRIRATGKDVNIWD